MSSEVFESREEDFKSLTGEIRHKLSEQAPRCSGGKFSQINFTPPTVLNGISFSYEDVFAWVVCISLGLPTLTSASVTDSLVRCSSKASRVIDCIGSLHRHTEEGREHCGGETLRSWLARTADTC